MGRIGFRIPDLDPGLGSRFRILIILAWAQVPTGIVPIGIVSIGMVLIGITRTHVPDDVTRDHNPDCMTRDLARFRRVGYCPVFRELL